MAYSHKEIIHCLVRKETFLNVKHLYLNIYYCLNAKIICKNSAVCQDFKINNYIFNLFL